MLRRGLARFERYPLMFGPSPIHELRRLTACLGGPRIWAKRDDCSSGLAFGGNKIRKLEYLLPEALAQGCDTLVSVGGIQSNHTRQVAAAAAVAGLKAYIIQEHWVDWPDIAYDRVGNIQLSRILGAQIELSPKHFDFRRTDSLARALEAVRERGGTPYGIPPGASDHPLGGLGFANFAVEVEAQEQALGVFFDHVVVCSVTGSTQAGMIVGFAAQGRPRIVIGIDASAKPAETRSAVITIARATAALLDLDHDITTDAVILETAWSGDTYGIPTSETLEAIRLVARLEGMITDPVYEGKSMAGLIGLVASGRIPSDATVLYVHLGGAPALNGYGALFSSTDIRG
jgi:1-aminocyclopropane-1-carboxylate deaminase